MSFRACTTAKIAALDCKARVLRGNKSALRSRMASIYTNRTLNLRSIKAVGFDMDYTLIHYNVDEWETAAYGLLREKLKERGWPVADLEFDPSWPIRGLAIDRELGNIVRANRFGYVSRASHGLKMMDFTRQRKTYARVQVDLKDARWELLNTFFSLSGAYLFAQLVERMDAEPIPSVRTYDDLFTQIFRALDETHMEGILKERIMNDPERYVVDDPQTALALLDMKAAGKKLLLITNSEWYYSQRMMSWTFDRHLPGNMTWLDLFDVMIVSARKPSFFETPMPLFKITDREHGALLPAIAIDGPGPWLGGDAQSVERYLGLSGDELLYVGDHLYSDVHVTKNMLRWRTALIVRDLEDDLIAQRAFAEKQDELSRLMSQKQELELQYSQMRLCQQRAEAKYGPLPEHCPAHYRDKAAQLRDQISELDQLISPLACEAGELVNETWGLLMRAGNDKSLLARQVERHADIYMSRVSNFVSVTPYAYLRAPRGILPHDVDLVTDPRDVSQTVDEG